MFEMLFDVAASVELIYVVIKNMLSLKTMANMVLRLNTYLDNIGTGVDLNIYYAKLSFKSSIPTNCW